MKDEDYKMIENNDEFTNTEENSYDIYSKIMEEEKAEEKEEPVEEIHDNSGKFVLSLVIISVSLIICCVFYYLFFLYGFPTKK